MTVHLFWQQLAFNYYFTRDARREVTPPTVLADPMAPKTLPAGQDGAAEAAVAAPVAARALGKTPGALRNYSQAKY